MRWLSAPAESIRAKYSSSRSLARSPTTSGRGQVSRIGPEIVEHLANSMAIIVEDVSIDLPPPPPPPPPPPQGAKGSRSVKVEGPRHPDRGLAHREAFCTSGRDSSASRARHHIEKGQRHARIDPCGLEESRRSRSWDQGPVMLIPEMPKPKVRASRCWRATVTSRGRP